MFYSQFILAKKGPLGTIWIAAHLERKLRKNQVADTDIGVSVDSILFPEVPIALRLSSHLLLGVVRIYSRKVNYLFDDCSEALLKIKQAFRSTAVDLPPEESTAPYHSITLPETFDLDDFELPDNDIFQGNYIDHHVSTREQITLQDTMDGVVYSTSQFGLDERFGDGDTSQVGLDLEEDLFEDKVATTKHDVVFRDDDQASIEPMDNPRTGASHGKMIRSSEDIPPNGIRNKIEDLAGNLEVIDYAQAPSTPGLVEEPNASSVKECMVCDDHLESEDPNSGILENAPSALVLRHGNDAMDFSLSNQLNHDSSVCTATKEYSCGSGDLEIIQATGGELLSASRTTEHNPIDESENTVDEFHKIEGESKVVSGNNEETVTSVDQVNGDCQESLEETVDVELAGKIEESFSNGRAIVLTPVHASEMPSALESDNLRGQGRQAQEDHETSNCRVTEEQIKPSAVGFIQPCNSRLVQPGALSGEVDNYRVADLQLVQVTSLSSDTLQREEGINTSETPTKVQGEECHLTDNVQSSENQMIEPILSEDIQADGERQHKQLDNAISDNALSNNNQHENLNSSVTSELPAPERLRSVSHTCCDEPHDLLVETPDKGVQEKCDGSAGTKHSGKKRSFADSLLTVQSLNSVGSFGETRSKRTVDSIPDDDDLLSSILVGRKSSVLKMKPALPAPEIPSVKRSRSVYRSSTLKRKVLTDDSMVLHGDTIRQQLTNTEDLHRLRKKAPCTLPEILMIQRQFLEEELFSQPVLTGMSADLTRLYGTAFDLSQINVCENDNNHTASLEVGNDEHSDWQVVKQDREIEGSTEPDGCKTDIVGQTAELSVQGDSQQDEDHLGSDAVDNQQRMNVIADINEFRTAENEYLGETTEMEIDMMNAEVSVATKLSVLVSETSPSNLLSGEIFQMPSGTADPSNIIDKGIGVDELVQADIPTLLSDKYEKQPIEDAACLLDTNNDNGNCSEKMDAVEIELGAGNELLEESKASAPSEIRDDELEHVSQPINVEDVSLANVSPQTGGCINFSHASIDQALEDGENDKHGHCDDGSRGGSSKGIDDNNQMANVFYEEEAIRKSLELDGDFKNIRLDDGDNTACQLVDQHNTIDMTNAPQEFDQDYTGGCVNIHDVGFANDTEFLNVDDDEVGEDDDEGFPNAEDNCLLENTGWSSRTRAVAKYLQTLFDREAEHGRNILLMNNLLSGKTRKEASRMFFETLVLKTKDYVDVEQAKPFESINIKARPKLMKSDF